MAQYHSQTLKNKLKAFLEGRDISIERFCQETGINREIGEYIYRDERYIPTPATLLSIVKTYSISRENFIVFDSEETSLYNENQEPMQVTICGCGNLGHVFAGLLSARQDLRVNLCVSSVEKVQLLEQGMAAQGGILVKRREGDVLARPHLVTAEPEIAIPGSRLILLCVPSHVEEEVLNKIVPFLDEDTYIGAIPGPGGFNWKAKYVLTQHNKNAVIFSLAAIPWMCKTVKPGEEVNVLGTKQINGQVTVPSERTQEVSELMNKLLLMPVLDLENFLNITLYPGNQLLHTAISYDLFHNWDGTPLPEPPLFYEEITEEAANLLQAMDYEVQVLCRTLEQKTPNLNLCAVLPLGFSIQSGYGDDIIDKSSLRSMVATNRAYAGIRTPMLKVEGGYIPNFQSRFFLEDVPHGLVVLKGIAELAGVATPTIDKILIWTQAKMGCEYLVDGKLQGKDVSHSGYPQRYGLNSLNELMESV
jgi:NAD/NADP octopine/nopaline dehydrogenase, alpha-helical domain/Ketopantoate reductase PanE/ApbA